MQWTIQPANAYGGVLLTRDGKILLREPANHFDGYLWTFAKGKPRAGVSPEETALREVWEECGYEAEIVDVLPGVYKSALSSNAYYVMRHLGHQQAFDWETWGTRWVSFDEAERLINETVNPKGKQRDLAVLAAAKNWFLNNRAVELPDAERTQLLAARATSWQNLQPLPLKQVRIELDIYCNCEQSKLIRLGFIPQAMEEKWFSYFSNNVLYQFRSWTGFCIDEIYFESSSKGLRAIYANVNRDPEQYLEVNDQEDANRIKSLLDQLASPERIRINSPNSLASLGLAQQSHYLGDPQVVAELLLPYFESIILSWVGRASYNDKLKFNQYISTALSSDYVGYTRMPDWHTEAALGKELIKCFDLDEDYCAGESLMFIASEALAAIDVGFGSVQHAVLHSTNTPQAEDVYEELQHCWHYVVAVLLGTHSVTFPEMIFKDLIEGVAEAAEQSDVYYIQEDLPDGDTPLNQVVATDNYFELLLTELRQMNRR